jgi:hypothetical protein
MIDLYVELKTVLQALEAAGVPYALCGGLALMVYQRPRATVDIDLIEALEALKDQHPDAFPGSDDACP